MTTRAPTAIAALRAGLRTAQGPMRARLKEAILRLEVLYGIRPEPTRQDQGDLRRGRFARAQHRIER